MTSATGHMPPWPWTIPRIALGISVALASVNSAQGMTVRGRVDVSASSLASAPLASASVRFVPVMGLPAVQSKTGIDGIYYLDNIQPGEFRVTIDEQDAGVFVVEETNTGYADLPPILVGQLGTRVREFLDRYRVAFSSKNAGSLGPFFVKLPPSDQEALARFFDDVHGPLALNFANVSVEVRSPRVVVSYLQRIRYVDGAGHEQERAQMASISLIEHDGEWKIQPASN